MKRWNIRLLFLQYAVLFALLVVLTGAYSSGKRLATVASIFAVMCGIGIVLRRSVWMAEHQIAPDVVKVFDDRGRLVQAGLGRASEVNPTIHEQLLAQRWQERQPTERGPWLGLGVWALFFVAWFGWVKYGPKVGWTMNMFIACAIAVIIAVVIGRIRRRQTIRNESSMLAAMGRCGACAYDLKPLGSAADGCVVCPECGAAWRRALPSGGAEG